MAEKYYSTRKPGRPSKASLLIEAREVAYKEACAEYIAAQQRGAPKREVAALYEHARSLYPYLPIDAGGKGQ